MRVELTAYGPEALERLAQVVGDLKGDDPMRPVTVLAPNNIAGLAARRRLARGVGGRPGIAGLEVTTVPRWAEQLAGASMLPRRPATRPVVATAIRRSLGERGGALANVSGHPATVQALARAHTELLEVAPADLEAIAATSAITAEVVALHCDLRRRLEAEWFEPVDLVRAAIAQLTNSTATGHLVLYLPQRLTPSETELVTTLRATGRLTAVLGLTGHERADASVSDLARRLTGSEPDAAPQSPSASRVLTASDADDEVRCVVREVVHRLRTTRADRVAVLYSARDPYARLLHEHLTAAGIRHNGPGVLAVADRAVSRLLLGVLTLPDSDLGRRELFDAISDAPTLVGRSLVPTSWWERISRTAGVVAGDDWQRGLDHHARHLEGRPDGGDEERRARDLRTAQETRRLQQFVLGLRSTLERLSAQTTWRELATRTLRLFSDLVGEPDELQRVPPEERYAAATIVTTLRSLAELDDLEDASASTALRRGLGGELASTQGGASLRLLRDVLAVELDRAVPRQGRYGDGVFIGPLSSAVGLDADVVYVVGLSEDLCPGRLHEDPLLGSEARTAAEGALAGSKERLETQHRHVLAALGAAPEVVASFARGDLRRSTERLPSRWLMPTLRLVGERPDLMASAWDEARTGVDSAPSFAGELLQTSMLATEQEWRVRAAAAGLLVDDTVAAARTMLSARASDSFTPFDGNLAGVDGLPDYAHSAEAIAPTRLEEYASCPHAWFAQRLLGVKPVEQPEDLVRVPPLELGNLVHGSLDDLVKELDAAGTLPGFGEPWRQAQRARLGELARARAAEMEARGVTGHPRLWDLEWHRVQLALGQLLDDDDAYRAAHDSAVVASELGFGQPDPVVEVTLPSGGRVRMRGSIDKVDRGRDGTLHVIDVKTGRHDDYRAISTDKPLGATVKLQLPVYGMAARQLLGDRASPVRACYWFVLRVRDRRELTLTPIVEETYAAAVDVLVSAIGAGLFPHRPPGSDYGHRCAWCNPDGVGSGHHRDRWKRKRSDPALARLLSLVEPEGVEA